jgi:argininosuccinate lyase
MLERDASRLNDTVTRLNVMPLGSGAIAGSTISLDRLAIAAELGFLQVSQNSMDAVSDRDFAIEAVSSLAILGMHLSRLSEDIVLWATSEFSFLKLSDRHTTGSSLMPQKKNPDIAELTRGKTGRLYGNLMSLLTLMKGLPLTYNRDMQEDKEAVFDSFDTTRAALQIFAEMLDGATFNEATAREAASDPALLATDLADALVLGGVPFRQAHEIVGKLVASAAAKGLGLDALAPEEFLSASPVLTPDVVRRTCDLDSAIGARKTAGAPSHTNVMDRLDYWRQHLPE